MKIIDLSGEYAVLLDNNSTYTASFPGTFDENRIGERETAAEKWHPDSVLDESVPDGIITTRFARKYAYEGSARLTRSLTVGPLNGKRAFIDAERARQLWLSVNGKEVTEYQKGTLSTPYIFEVTDSLKEENTLTFTASNKYEDLPATAIKYSSAATNETQTNWLGILGHIQLRIENPDFISRINTYTGNGSIDITVEIDASEKRECNITISSDVFSNTLSRCIELNKGINTIVFNDIKIKADAERWDEYEGNLHTLTVSGDGLDEKSVNFGIREFGDDGKGHLALNGHRIFMRCEANCGAVSDCGHIPMTVDEWREILLLYKSYGVNTVRFHSHCPCDAAFTAADELGIIVQPELSNWDPKNALESEESFEYYRTELVQIIKTYGNHPSFCMLTFGNELACNDTGLERLHKMLDIARECDDTRMYAIGSNVFYGERGADEKSDFFTASNYYKDMLRGTSAGPVGYINSDYPDTKHNFNAVMAKLRKSFKKPVFSFEVGQYEILPDFKEIDLFKGVLIPDNLIYVRDRVTEKGFIKSWEQWVEATGELSLIAYREEIEAVLRTEDMSGISLLGLQDFPGQGTALVGMINSHFMPKPYSFAKPERFRRFFRSQLPLVKLDKYTYTTDEALEFEVVFANYGKNAVNGEVICSLEINSEVYISQKASAPTCLHSMLTNIGRFTLSLEGIQTSTKAALKVSVNGIENEYPIWIYTENNRTEPQNVITCTTLEEALVHLEAGKRVFLSPKGEKESFVESIKTNFTTDFWSVGTFAFQEGYMGCLPKPEHPLFAEFPTESHADWQWWALTDSAAMVLPDGTEPLFDVMDSYARLRRLGFIVECNAGNGKLLISSMGLLEKTQYPEVRAMLGSIYSYMESDSFCPKQTVSEKTLRKIIVK